MARWFSPQEADCSCECSGLPPVYDCGCPLGDCLPTGKQNFSSIRMVFECTDEMLCISELISYPNCSNIALPCYKESRIWRHTQQISGLSNFDGTYDASYVKYDGGVLVESDPTKNPCGYWFFPYVEGYVSWETDQEFIYPSACLTDTSGPTSGSGTIAMSTYNGQFVTGGSYASPHWPQLGVLTPAFYTASMPFTWLRTQTFGYFNCQDGDTPDDVEEDDIPISDDAGIGVLPALDEHIRGTAGGSPLGLPTQVTVDEYDGVLGQVISWHTGASQCTLQYESAEFDIPAYAQTQLSASYTCGNFPPISVQNTHKLNFNAFNRRITVSLNV